MIVDEIAKVCHQVNKAFCEGLGDYSQVDWEELSIERKESSVMGVVFVKYNPDCTAEQIHNNWCKDKKEAGWVYGDVKDEAKKTHPCLIQYKGLPKEQRAKDELFIATVKGLL